MVKAEAKAKGILGIEAGTASPLVVVYPVLHTNTVVVAHDGGVGSDTTLTQGPLRNSCCCRLNFATLLSRGGTTEHFGRKYSKYLRHKFIL